MRLLAVFLCRTFFGTQSAAEIARHLGVSRATLYRSLAVTGGGTYTLTFSAAGLVPATSATLVVAPATQGTIVFKVGASATASGVIGTNLPIPFIADMSGAQGLRLASLSFGLTWDPTKFDFVSTTNGTFGTGPSFFVNTANQAGGSITISVFDTDGFSTGTPTIYTVTLKPKASVAATIITAGITAAGDVNGNTIPNGAFTVRPLSVSTP